MVKSLLLSVILVTGSLGSNAQSPPVYEIYALKYFGLHSVPVSELALGAPRKDTMNMFFMYWLIRGNNGKNILVDAGFLNDLDIFKTLNKTFYVRPDSVLLEMNLKADEITDIILSHPHWDHIDGVSLFPKAHIWIQKEDYNYFVGEAWQKEGRHGGFYKRDVDSLVSLNLVGKLTPVEGDDKEIFPGIRVYTGSRHTYNSQYVMVQTDGDKVILASDNIWIYYNLNHLKSSPYPNGTFDTTAYVRSMQRMKTQASNIKYIIPGHDPAVFTRFHPIKSDIVQIR
ncbi:MAG: N-acyl homoserine lactonase family protein [Bacteroidota bacterium]|nr:N-acyl homoserine lactonase family protein [Bacteroidota bacterium]